MVGLIVFAGIICALISLYAMKKSRHFIKYLFLTVLQGWSALLAVNASGLLTGVTLPLNALTLGVSAIFGTPGVIMNLLIKIILAT